MDSAWLNLQDHPLSRSLTERCLTAPYRKQNVMYNVHLNSKCRKHCLQFISKDPFLSIHRSHRFCEPDQAIY